MKSLHIDGLSLKLEQVCEVAFNPKLKVSLSPKAKIKIQQGRDFISRKMAGKDAIYGVNTGFGALSSVRIDSDKLIQLQINLLRSHAVGIGEPLSIPEVRASVLLRANALSQGYSGVSVELIEALIALLNEGVHPWIPCQGSVGASGDLAPLAHLALVLMGEGKAYYRGELLSGAEALKRAKLKTYQIQPKEGLSLINGTQIMTAIGVLSFMKAEKLAQLADLASAMSLEAFAGSKSPYDESIQSVRPHEGQGQVAANMRRLLSNSEIMESHKDCKKVQDPYSFRCIPQVHGACLDVLKQVRRVLEVEINSVTDNPLVFPEKKKIINGGNFHGEYVAIAMDQMAVAVSEIASISEQRIQKLISPSFSDLPLFLVKSTGLNSGFMIVHVAAAALVSENKSLSHPASVDSIPTNVDKEDHVSMGPIAARKARAIVNNSWNVIAIEFFSAAQGLEFRKPLKPAKKIYETYKSLRKVISPVTQDRAFYEDIHAAASWMEKISI